MTNQDIITSVRRKLNDTGFDSATITEAANWFVSEIFNNTRTRMMEANSVITVSIGAYSASLPSGTLITETITSPANRAGSLEDMYAPYNDFQANYPTYATATRGPIQAWTDFAQHIRFSCPVDVAYTISLDYLRSPVKMVALTDVCEIPDNYAEMVIRGTTVRIMELNEDYGEASSERSILSGLVTNFVRNEGRGQAKTGPNIMRMKRRSIISGPRGMSFN